MENIKFNTKEIFKDWTKTVWPGNPALNLDAAVKTFVNPHNGRKVPVWVFGKENEENCFSYTVNAGESSDYSYTGSCTDCFTLVSAQLFIDYLHKERKIFK